MGGHWTWSHQDKLCSKTRYFAKVKIEQFRTWGLIGQVIGGQVAGSCIFQAGHSCCLVLRCFYYFFVLFFLEIYCRSKMPAHTWNHVTTLSGPFADNGTTVVFCRNKNIFYKGIHITLFQTPA